MTESLIRWVEQFDGQVVRLELGPPPGNILTMDAIAELSELLARADAQAHTKLVVLTGSGKHFSFGASVEEHAPSTVRDMLPRFHALVGQMLRLRVPLLARVHGVCLGGGFEVALACPLIFADERAKLGVPELGLGVFPPPASVLLPARAGETAAAEIILSAASFDAATMQRFGVVNRVAEHGRLDAAIDAFIEEHVVGKSASSLRIANQALRMPLVRTWDEHIDALESLYLDVLMNTRDAVEGLEAFLEKRDPIFKDS